jgi:hypothetical protein
MYVLAVNHDVADYDTWKKSFDTFPPARGGARFHRVNRSLDNANNVTIVSGFDTAEAALGFRDNPELKQVMGDAGVIGAPRFEIYDEVEAIQY